MNLKRKSGFLVSIFLSIALLLGFLPVQPAKAGNLAPYGYVYDNEATAQTIGIGSDINFSNNGPLSSVTHTAGTSGITVGSAGVYNVLVGVNTAGNNPEGWGIAVNGTVVQHFTAAGQSITFSAKLSLNANDVVSIRNVDTSGSLATLRAGVNSAWVQIDQVNNAYGYVYDNENPAQSIATGSDMSFSNNGPLQYVSHTSGTSGVTVNNAGTYNILAGINTAGNNPEGWGIAVNGTVVQHFTAAGQSITFGAKLALNAGDIVSIRNVDTSGTSATLRAGVNSAWMQIDQADNAYGYVYDNENPAQSISLTSDMNFSNNGPLQYVSHTAGTSSITVTNAGVYNITFTVNTAGNNPEGWGIAVNGTVVQHFTAAGQSITSSAKLSLNAGDVISIRNVDSSGTSATLRAGVNSAWVQIDQY